MSTKNDLLEYVRSPDPTFRWERLGAERVASGTLYDLRLFSQTWQGLIWTHRLHLYLPDRCQPSEWALLTIGSDHVDGISHVDFALANRRGIPAAVLYDIPNQPLFDGLREDELLAFTLSQGLDSDDPTWPLLFPMVKAAVRAMDTISAKCGEEGRAPVARFIVHGASKRGWTTWLAAAADSRVGAIMPEVYDNLNLFAQMPHQVKVWAAYSEMIEDYTAQHLQERMRTPRGRHIAQTIDPYAYRSQLTLPKLLIHSLNDRYWATDALNLYWDDLTGDKHVLYAPNQPHNIADRTAIRPTQEAFVRAVLSGACLPEVASKFTESDSGLQIELRVPVPASEGRLWVAGSASQDFRAAAWEPRPMASDPEGCVFTATVARPESGHLALVSECLIPSDEAPYLLSSQVYILSCNGQ